MPSSRRLPPLLALPVALAFVFACGGGSGAAPSAAPAATTPPSPTATPTPTPAASPAPAWWEEGRGTPTPPAPLVSRVWNTRVEAVSAGEVTVTFDYRLELAPEANVFVHQGLLPDTLVAVLDGEGDALGNIGGKLEPTEFGDDVVVGQATFDIATTRFDDIVAAHVCIRVVTGNYDDFAGRSEVFCEPVPIEKVPP